ncbi:MAG: hypothetical protein PHQ43_05370, partial [Dehalococcoidales bacterium]|nr:hypothetical protein [Dehalococcoidales bacterium]
MIHRIKRYLSVLLVCLISLSVIMSTSPVQAINEPDTEPQVSAVYVYEFENGAVGVLIDYYLDYATLPDETATDSYLGVFVDTDGVTQLKAVAPYTFVDSGYGRGLIWIPFTAAEATAASLDSADIANYRVWLTGNPTLPWTDVTATGAMTGAVADDGGVQTDETAESNSVAANDMTLLPAVPAVNDAYYFGGADPFDLLTINIGTQGSGTWDITWEYWNGSAWTSLSGISDGTLAFEAAVGNRDVSWTMPTNWNTVAVNGTAAYWVRARVSSYTAVVTQPLGTQSWINPADSPPKTITTVNQWVTSSVSETLASRILYYTDVLEIAWTLDMVESTADGNRLTSVGESYFTNVIAGCRTLAPDAFSDVTSDPNYIPVSYDTAFGATATSGTATVVGSPQTLAEGTDTVDTGITVGTIIINLAQWTRGTITDDTGTMAGSPVTLYPGVNTLTVNAAGTFTTDLEVVDTATTFDDAVTGTGFDLTGLATVFGMSRWMLSGIVWTFVTILVCAAAYIGGRRSSLGDGGGASKVVMVLFAIMMIGGMLLGLLHPLVVSFMLIAYGAFIGYVLFFRSESLHKGFMFMMWMFVIVSISGNIAASGQSGITTTRLTSTITDTETASIPVASTAGFPDSGIIVIGDEQISYPDKDATHFLDTTFNPIIRGSGDTEAVAHAENASVRTKESYIINASLDYKIARITDSAGVLSYIAMPFLLLDLVFTFFKLPLEFFGTDLAVLSYIWMVVAVGMIFGFVVTLAG